MVEAIAGGAQVGLGTAVVAVIRILHSEDGGGQGDIRIGILEELAYEFLCCRLSALAVLDRSQLSRRICEVMGKPIVVVEVRSCRQVRVDGNGVGDAEFGRTVLDVVDLFLESVFGGVYTDDLQTGILIGLVKLLNAGH